MMAITDFSVVGEERVMLTVHLSNYRHARGRFWKAPRLGLHSVIEQVRYFEIILNGFILGVLVVIALYHLALFLQRRRDIASFYFALYCAAMAMRYSVVTPMVEGDDHLNGGKGNVQWLS